MHLSILYRGSLSSCNYECHYCPFAKQVDSKAELQQDERELQRFVNWCTRQPFDLSIFFTPWGEALTRTWYWQAFADLTNSDNIKKVAVQTNLSCKLSWLADCDRKKVGIWATYHPSQVGMKKFLSRVKELEELQVACSVGMVGLKEDFSEIENLRSQLPAGVYLWINAYKRIAGYYSPEDVGRLVAIDPHFEINNTRHPSLGEECNTGRSVVTVDGKGDVRRCHFVPNQLGNIYESDIDTMLAERRCPNATCGCHIGYVHMPKLEQERIYADGLLERIPVDFAASNYEKHLARFQLPVLRT